MSIQYRAYYIALKTLTLHTYGVNNVPRKRLQSSSPKQIGPEKKVVKSPWQKATGVLARESQERERKEEIVSFAARSMSRFPAFLHGW